MPASCRIVVTTLAQASHPSFTSSVLKSSFGLSTYARAIDTKLLLKPAKLVFVVFGFPLPIENHRNNHLEFALAAPHRPCTLLYLTL
jgi:hypothetical protein